MGTFTCSTHSVYPWTFTQCAAVRMCFADINEPPHLNERSLSPTLERYCSSAIHGNWPTEVFDPPTIRSASALPHFLWLISFMFGWLTMSGEGNLMSDSSIWISLQQCLSWNYFLNFKSPQISTSRAYRSRFDPTNLQRPELFKVASQEVFVLLATFFNWNTFLVEFTLRSW